MQGSVFITGGTGFLGTELCARLLEICDSPIYALVRASCDAEAFHRLREAWQHDRALYAAIGVRVFPVPGDFEKPGLGLAPAAERALRECVTRIFHAGAEVGFRESEVALTSVNREGTRNILAFAASLQGLERFVQILSGFADHDQPYPCR